MRVLEAELVPQLVPRQEPRPPVDSLALEVVAPVVVQHCHNCSHMYCSLLQQRYI